ncbi:hypothetical protein FRB99_008033 [Tulasnella sp. 403]|nr:hypothetical protein FRB99_008033 [Tulasnella sp. 403]
MLPSPFQPRSGNNPTSLTTIILCISGRAPNNKHADNAISPTGPLPALSSLNPDELAIVPFAGTAYGRNGLAPALRYFKFPSVKSSRLWETRLTCFPQIWAVCIVIALAADQAPNTTRWRLLMMSNSEEQEWLNACLEEEGPLVLPSEDPRVKQVSGTNIFHKTFYELFPTTDSNLFDSSLEVLRVAERIIAVLGEDCTLPSHYVSAAAWPSSLSPSYYEEYFRGENEKRVAPEDRSKPKEYLPSEIATSHLIPHRLESSNPMKVFSDQDWKIYVIDLPKVNAFALPTREIFVYTGLIDLLGDDSLLSGILAHEIAHVTQRHAVENAGFLNLAAIAFDCLRGISFAFTISFPLITDAAASFLNLIHDHVADKAYSRKLEMEADAVGLKFMSMAGYNPHAMLDLWDVMALVEEDAAASGTPISITDRLQFLKTHPTSLQRQRNIDKLLPNAMKLYNKSPFRHMMSSPTTTASTQESSAVAAAA